MTLDENLERTETEKCPHVLDSNDSIVKYDIPTCDRSDHGSRHPVSRGLVRSATSSAVHEPDEENGILLLLRQGKQQPLCDLELSKEQCPESSRKKAGSSYHEFEKGALVDLENLSGSRFVDNDDEYDQMEEEEGDDACIQDPFANQFIHIGIPATGLKDVSRVKRDLYHDRVNTKKSMLGGLHRAASSVRISESRSRGTKANSLAPLPSSRPLKPAPDNIGFSNFRHLTRMLSLKKTKSSTVTSSKSKCEQPHGDRGHGKSLEASGKDWNLNSSASTDGRTVLLKTPALEQHEAILDKKREDQAMTTASPDSSNRLLIQRHRDSIAQRPSLKRETLYSSSHHVPVNGQENLRSTTRAVSATAGDRPRPSRVISPDVPRGRASLSQVGRLLSFSRKRTSDNMKKARDRHGSDVQKIPSKDKIPSEKTKHSSLAKIGRAISLSRNISIKMTLPDKNNSSQSFRTNFESEDALCTTAQPISGDQQTNPNGISTETPVHSESTRTSRSDERFQKEREIADIFSATSTSSGELIRPKLKTIGRMFSLSKHSANLAARVQRHEAVDRPKLEKLQREDAALQSLELGGESRSGARYSSNAGKFYFIAIPSEQVHSSGSIRDLSDLSYIRVPIITMGEFIGPGSRSLWHTDVFTLPHNAVRRECMDLYDILISMAQSRKAINISTYAIDISAKDINDFEQWWFVARELFQFYFEVERRILFPWVDSAGSHDLEVRVALKKMRGMKEKLEEQLANIDRVWNEKTFKSHAEMFVIIYKAVDNFVPRLLNYFEDQEVLLPALAQSFCKAEERVRIDKEIAALLMGDEVRKNKEVPNHRLILLIRWMNDPKLVRTWTGRYLSSWARNMYPSWYQKFETHHYRIVKMFQSRWEAKLL
eukprot:TRINITY_DN11641_c0_g1_i1.p1 TRINITY_DN11641_c0_g1~~TRINITY_DN11641_c0_g1_i1.p1  ORF type:complete len:885 (+),score=104.88 TRINITY_DN11641_c0_g1_i1:189-2843(+)